MKAIILSAGRGNRMRPLTDHTPKPLVKIGEYSLIEYHLLNLAKANIRDVVINVSYHPQQFVKTLGDGSAYGVNIQYSFEPEENALETGGGIFQALPKLGNGPFIAVSADLWTDFPFQNLPQKFFGLAHLVLVDNPEHNLKGDFSLQNNQVSSNGDHKLNFGGIGVYDPKLFQQCTPGKFSIVPLLIEAMQKKLVSGEYYQGHWVNVGTLEQLEKLRKQVIKL